MTGLPQSMVKQNKDTLKFKTKKQPVDNFDTQSTMSQRTTMSSQAAASPLTDKQLMYDNQMLTNELIVINRDLQKHKTELK